MAALGLVLVLLALLAYAIRCLREFSRKKAIIDLIQGPRSFSLVGNIHQFKAKPDDFFEQACGVAMMYRNPRMLRIWLTWKAYIMVYGAREAESILSSNKHINKSQEYTLIQPWLGLGLLTSYADKWRPRRKLLTPTFHYDILKDYVEVFVSQTKTLVSKLAELEGKGAHDVYQLITLCALDIICETAMGKDLKAQRQEESDYVRAVYKIGDIIHERQKKPWLWPSLLFRLLGRGSEHSWCLSVLHGFTTGVIQDRVKERAASKENNNNLDESGTVRRQAFLDLLLGMVERGEMPMEDVRSEVDTFMFEGHDTTSAGLNWALHLLSTNPLVQTKVQAEIDEVFGETERDLSFEDLKNLHYLECVLKEALRLYPSVPIFARTLHEEAVVAGYQIPKGTQVVVLPYVVHRDPEFWPDPDTFDPDRFLPENAKGRHPYAYLPFSAGSRNCIGQRFALMEEKTVMAMILRYFTIASAHRRDQVRPKAELILRPTQGVHLFIRKRRPIPQSFAFPASPPPSPSPL